VNGSKPLRLRSPGDDVTEILSLYFTHRTPGRSSPGSSKRSWPQRGPSTASSRRCSTTAGSRTCRRGRCPTSPGARRPPLVRRAL